MMLGTNKKTLSVSNNVLIPEIKIKVIHYMYSLFSGQIVNCECARYVNEKISTS